MGAERFYKTTIRIEKKTIEKLIEISKNRDEPLSFIIRKYINIGLATEFVDESTDIIASIVREQLDIVLKPYVERLAKIGSKSGHMSATAAFLNVQALMDLVPTERRKNVKEMYESARKKAVAYMANRTDDFKNEIGE